jgi:hypothetical protein
MRSHPANKPDGGKRMRIHLQIVMLICIAGTGTAELIGNPPVAAELISVKRIWDKGQHNAFTDLVRWQGKLYCAFREGRRHVSTDGKIRVIVSATGESWESVTLLQLKDYDLRDAHLCVTPENNLMVVGGAAPRKKETELVPTGTFVSFSSDGKAWSTPAIVVTPGRWLWSVTWHNQIAYGMAYGKENGLDLLVSKNGREFETKVKKLYQEHRPTEVTLRFDPKGKGYALMRRDGRQNNHAMLGLSDPPYTNWQWREVDIYFGGPNFISIPGGYWIGAGRISTGGAHTAITFIDFQQGSMEKILKLPSGGDTSYPGLVWYKNLLYVSYYSSHEGKTNIYLAKVKITPKSN